MRERRPSKATWVRLAVSALPGAEMASAALTRVRHAAELARGVAYTGWYLVQEARRAPLLSDRPMVG